MAGSAAAGKTPGGRSVVRLRGGLGSQRGLSLVDDGLKGSRFAGGEVSQNLAVHVDAGQLQAVDEAGVGQAVQTHAGVDALNPQAAEIALLIAPVAIGVT